MDVGRLSKKELGDYGENLAVDYLQKAGLKIVLQNYWCPKGEIDIVARDGKWLVFVEVRARTSGRRGYAEESIGHRKNERLKALGAYYLLEHGYNQWPQIRFDVLAINFKGEEPLIKWIKGIM